MDDVQVGRYISYLLRHHPEDGNLNMDSHGWVPVDELITAVCVEFGDFSYNDLARIVDENNKQRYSFSDDRQFIRANQGHSINVNLELEPLVPPPVLYHGTATRFVDSIMEQGILPQSRQYVHLSETVEAAVIVGKRHGEPYILVIDANRMYEDGYEFRQSVNGVWLTDEVPIDYITFTE